MSDNNYNEKGKSIHKGYYDGKNINWMDWGKPFYSSINELKIKSVCDVGCGNGLFVNNIAKMNFEKIYGVDLVTVSMGLTIDNPKVTYIDAPASNIPIENKSVELLTAFDVLEHIHPSNVENSLREFSRISSKYFMFSISHRLSGEEHNGENLHLTVYPFDWWCERIGKYADIVKKDISTDGTRSHSIWRLKNYKPKLFCDIDSTINNHWKRIQKWTVPKFPNDNIDPKAFTREEVMKDEPLEDAIESINELSRYYEIYFLTARDFPEAKSITTDWLNKYGFLYKGVIVVNSIDEKLYFIRDGIDFNGEKLIFNRENDIFIDDFSTKHQYFQPYENLKWDVISHLNYENINYEIFNNNWKYIVYKYVRNTNDNYNFNISIEGEEIFAKRKFWNKYPNFTTILNKIRKFLE